MDCVDCHNRPSHAFELPEKAVDRAITEGRISRALPFVKKKTVELLRKEYADRATAERQIASGLVDYYRTSLSRGLPAAPRARRERARRPAKAIYLRNVFPDMKVSWGTHPNHIGHEDFLGCFRCHDETHKATTVATITQDCNACHTILAQDETDPKVLADLGLTPAPCALSPLGLEKGVVRLVEYDAPAGALRRRAAGDTRPMRHAAGAEPRTRRRHLDPGHVRQAGSRHGGRPASRCVHRGLRRGPRASRATSIAASEATGPTVLSARPAQGVPHPPGRGGRTSVARLPRASRDYLRAHAEAARRFADVKRVLAARFPRDREAYTNAKSSHIREILRLASGAT